MKLFDNVKSSAAYRVRIALHLKGLHPDNQLVVIHGSAATHREPAYLDVNPQGLVPSLAIDDGRPLTQSLAIIEYLDEIRPHPPLLPSTPESRADARSLALSVACDIHPFGTPRVANRLIEQAGFTNDGVQEWTRHWVSHGLTAVERFIRDRRSGRFAIGSAPTVADIFLVPQAAVAERLGLKLDAWPNIRQVVTECRTLQAFTETAPDFTAAA